MLGLGAVDRAGNFEWIQAVMIENYDSVDVFVGVDVGKGEHHAVALNAAGEDVLDKALPNHEAKMRSVFQKLKTYGTVLVVVDQPATIGALPALRKRECGLGGAGLARVGASVAG